MIGDKTLVQNPYYHVESDGLTPYNRLAVLIYCYKMVRKSLTACEEER
ncbi:hypothetical protein SAMN05216175_10127 [Neptunomonas qingdaonensis]|uniref:Uncharacterized protein n=1 Tax=Neptunomonas qingdaonensis TaxID=1045558 RepID=A0A1I2LIG7_9GAMM|nr:hypothetical protein SAMN05216175_10127 [Neptunomonas qingdaonensis]